MAEAVRDALGLVHVLQSEAENGFTELVVRNPATGDERVLIVPSMRRPLRSVPQSQQGQVPPNP
jgi:hypothetical protein